MFVDESGDLGGSRSNKRYFVIAAVLCEEAAIKTTIQDISKKFGLPELKFSELSYDEKVEAVKMLSPLEFKVAYVVLSKNDRKLRDWLDKSKRNKSLAAMKLHGALVQGLQSYGAPQIIVVDRSQYSKDISGFLSRRYSLAVAPGDSQKRAGLQLADAMANVIYLHYQYKNGELIDEIRDKIIFGRFINERELRRL
ncbi:DUF3800 domain-containing protein [Thermococcus nautili]|uniref:DUF3800 domain-containing protein n=1 Tax=Thermococcus nautili TaxID=195522 RepID=UPI00146FAF12|nr:DUF3800 domain-containing protein [Thermococcus nautili]